MRRDPRYLKIRGAGRTFEPGRWTADASRGSFRRAPPARRGAVGIVIRPFFSWKREPQNLGAQSAISSRLRTLICRALSLGRTNFARCLSSRDDLTIVQRNGGKVNAVRWCCACLLRTSITARGRLRLVGDSVRHGRRFGVKPSVLLLPIANPPPTHHAFLSSPYVREALHQKFSRPTMLLRPHFGELFMTIHCQRKLSVSIFLKYS